MAILGQHFLKSKSASWRIIDKIIKAAELSKKDVVLEVGPGKGILTKALLEKAGKVIAVEKDRKLVKHLKEKFKDYNNLEIIEGDVLKISAKGGPASGGQIPKNYKIVANIPYYITSRFLKTFLAEVKFQPKKMVLMVQKEVGERIIAKPPKMNLLAISVQVYGQPKIIANVSKKHFLPQPKVDSVIIAISNISRNFFKPKPKSKSANKYDRKYLLKREKEFFKIVKAGFAHKRKLVLNNLKKLNIKDFHLENCKIDKKARAENLSLENWKCLCLRVKSK